MKKILCNFLLILMIYSSQAQLIDYVHIYAGARAFGGNESFDFNSGLPSNVFSGYGVSPVIGISVLRELTNNLSIGAGIEFCNSTRKVLDTASYNLNNNTVYTLIKYNLTRVERTFSPYLHGGFSVSFISIQQPRYITTVQNPNARKPEDLTYLRETTYNKDYSNVLFAPALGGFIGVGLDIKIREGWGLFLQYAYNLSFTSNVKSLQKFYPPNNSQNLGYHSFNFGLRVFL